MTLKTLKPLKTLNGENKMTNFKIVVCDGDRRTNLTDEQYQLIFTRWYHHKNNNTKISPSEFNKKLARRLKLSKDRVASARLDLGIKSHEMNKPIRNIEQYLEGFKRRQEIKYIVPSDNTAEPRHERLERLGLVMTKEESDAEDLAVDFTDFDDSSFSLNINNIRYEHKSYVKATLSHIRKQLIERFKDIDESITIDYCED